MILALIMLQTQLKNPLATHKFVDSLLCVEEEPFGMWTKYRTDFQATIEIIFDQLQLSNLNLTDEEREQKSNEDIAAGFFFSNNNALL